MVFLFCRVYGVLFRRRGSSGEEHRAVDSALERSQGYAWIRPLLPFPSQIISLHCTQNPGVMRPSSTHLSASLVPGMVFKKNEN